MLTGKWITVSDYSYLLLEQVQQITLSKTSCKKKQVYFFKYEG